MWETILITAATVLVTLTVTWIFNTIVNSPKKRRQQREAEKAEAERKQKAFEDRVDQKLDTIQKDMGLCKRGIQVNLKNDLKVRYDYWIDLGYAPEDAKDDLEKMYQVYHNMGKNGVMDSRREAFLRLPSDPPTQNN